MADVVTRHVFVSGIVEYIFSSSGGTDKEVSRSITELILSDAFVSEAEWQTTLKSEPEWLNLSHIENILELYLKGIFHSHPPATIAQEQLPRIMGEVVGKIRANGDDCEWPYSYLCQAWEKYF